MVVKLKDIYKLANSIVDFLRKLDADSEFAAIRDTLNLALLNLQRYYKLLNYQFENFSSTKFVIIDKYSWKWINLPNKRFSSEIPIVLQAIKSQNVEELKAQLKENISDKCDCIGRSVLQYGVHYFNENIFKNLTEAEMNSGQIDQERQNALRLTCKEGNLFALKVLLDQGADGYSSDEFGRTALHWAVTSADTLCLKHLLEHGFDSTKCSDYEGMTPTMWAAYLDKIDHLKVLLSNKRCPSNLKNRTIDDDRDDGCDDDADEKDQYGRMWIHWCVHRSGDHLCLKEFLNKEVLKLKDNLGRSIVHVAAEKGSLEAMKMICSVGGSDIIEERDTLDRTPLIIAAMGGHGELMNHLLSLGADILKVDKFGASAWDYARSNQLHYCMLIIASYLRQSTDRPAIDLSSSINFNQSLRLSLTRSRSIDRQDDTFHHGDKQQTNTNDYPLKPPSESHDEPLRPRPPKTPSASPLGNFRRHKTSSNSETQGKNNPAMLKMSSKDGEEHALYNNPDDDNTSPNSKEGRKKMKKSPKRHMFRREATTMMDSSSEESSDKEQHVQSFGKGRPKKWNKKTIQLVPDAFEGRDEQPHGGYQKMQNLQSGFLQEHGIDAPSNRRQNNVFLAHNKLDNEMLMNKQTKPSKKKVNFSLDSNSTNQNSVENVDISNLVSMDNFAKWEVNFSNQPELESDLSRKEINPWNRRSNDILPNSPHNHSVVFPLADMSSDHPNRSFHKDRPKKLAKTRPGFNQEEGVANEEVSGLKRNPTPAPRRLSRIDGNNLSNFQEVNFR